MKKTLPILALLFLAGCSTGYKIENGAWSWVEWNEAVGRSVVIVNGADQNSFKLLNEREYAKDNKNVYWGAAIIKGADPNTFECLNNSYGKDKAKVFWEVMEIKGADPDSFQLIKGHSSWSKDKNDVYYWIKPLGAKNLSSFEIINDGWARDNEAYYAGSIRKVGKVDCDYATMKILNEYYAIDNNRAYYEGDPMENVDVKTFHLTGVDTAKDQYRKFQYGEPVDSVK